MDFEGLRTTGLTLVESMIGFAAQFEVNNPLSSFDEYQDLGLALQSMVLALMPNAGVRIIAVGDPDQSIYGFTGAQHGLLRPPQRTA